ncbi:PAS domain-containing protein [Sphingobium sp. HBC34]|uniref:PAS domain-containing protein n=1 Tax=Sphingobium cyanobacteriorum TaxID=3063954 RepID=A0ABT8ZL94_9SPHN|nr:PAS domain-containing protein [Sphingobium sp. HBC34]MDO7835231.1 PAS domain-containing protein [Sphingobium sp. HBC34]
MLAVEDGVAPAPDRTFELAARMHQGLILCGADLAIDYANSVALAMTRRWNRPLEGQHLWDAFPELTGTLTEAHIRHSLSSGEASAADIPSPFRDDSWLHLQTFPFGQGVALLMRDITADLQRHRLADVKSAMLKAMGVHGGLSYVRMSARGFIEVTDDNFCTLVGLSAERLKRVAMADLVELSVRPHFREQLEGVLRGDGDRRVTTHLLTNGGTVASVDAAIARLHGIYGTEGAIMLMTPAQTA